MAASQSLKRRIIVTEKIGKLSKIALCFLLLNSLVAMAGSVRVSVSENSIQLGDVVEVELSIEGDLDSDPKFPDIDGVQIQSAGKSSNVSIINGDISRSVVFKFLFSFEKAGRITIPAIELDIDDKLERTRPFTINVAKVKTLSDNQIKSQKPLFFIRRSVSNETPYVGEPVVESINIYRRMDWAGATRFGNDNINLKYYEIKGTKESREEIDGTLYGVTTLTRVFVPLKSGELELGTFGVEVQYQQAAQRRRGRDPFDFFRQPNLARKRVLAPGVTIGVNNVPQKGKPKDYSGFVGQLELSTDISSSSVKTGDTVTLTVKATGNGWISSLGLEEIVIDENFFKVYPDKPESSESASVNGLSGFKQLKYALVPIKEGDTELGSYTLSFFDPVKKKYVTKTIDLGRLNIEKGEVANTLLTNNPGTNLKSGPKNSISSIGEDIFDIKRSSDTNGDRLLIYVFSLSGLLILIYILWSEIGFTLSLRKARKDTRAQYLKLISTTRKSFKKQDSESLMTGFQLFLSKETNVNPQSITVSDIIRYFEKTGADTDSDVFRVLKYHENHKYGGVAPIFHCSPKVAVESLKSINLSI